MTATVAPATADDLAAIRAVYAHGRAQQVATGGAAWPEFPDSAILAEIAEARLMKISDGSALLGVFSVVYDDALLWGALERGAHVYLHRITRGAAAQGGLMDVVMTWSREHARTLGREGLRLDTWAASAPLVSLYQRYGFSLLGTRVIAPDPRLSPHYHGLELALMELAFDTEPGTPSRTNA